MKIEVLDGPVYQWDTGRKVKVVGEGVAEVHFSYMYSQNALVTKPTDGIVSIPSVLLQTGENLAVYIVCTNGDGQQTVARGTVYVNRRSKPDDYIYTEDEVFMFKQLEERIVALEKNSGSGTGGVVGVSDVLVNGVSVVVDGAANIPIANEPRKYGVTKYHSQYGVYVDSNGFVQLITAGESSIKDRSVNPFVLAPSNYDLAVKCAMTDGKGAEWSSEEKAMVRERMGLGWKLLGDVTVEEDGVAMVEIAIDNPNYNEYQVYVYANRINNLTNNTLLVNFNSLTTSTYALLTMGVGTKSESYIRGVIQRHTNGGWISHCVANSDKNTLTGIAGRGGAYSEAWKTDKPTSINVSLATGLDIGSRFVVYAR